jgi:hypothetical protein
MTERKAASVKAGEMSAAAWAGRGMAVQRIKESRIAKKRETTLFIFI